jgi:hypothetical protein
MLLIAFSSPSPPSSPTPPSDPSSALFPRETALSQLGPARKRSPLFIASVRSKHRRCSRLDPTLLPSSGKAPSSRRLLFSRIFLWGLLGGGIPLLASHPPSSFGCCTGPPGFSSGGRSCQVSRPPPWPERRYQPVPAPGDSSCPPGPADVTISSAAGC